MSIPHALPAGRIIATDQSTGKTYVAKPASGETSWVPPPSPPPPTKIQSQSNIVSSSDEQISNQYNFPVQAAKRLINEAKEGDNIEPMEINSKTKLECIFT